MQVVDKIYSFLREQILKRIKVEQKKEFNSFKSAKLVGIVMNLNDPTSENAYNTIKNALKINKIEHKQVVVDLDKNPQNSLWCISNPNILIINKQEVDWLGTPKLESIEDFISTEFDILINLSTSYCYTIDYIITSTKSKLTVGANISKKRGYDFEICNNAEAGQFTAMELSKEIINRLSSIKNQ